MTEIRENRLLLGNPGTGKSTLVNCLVGQRVFNSGVSWGGGLTQEYQKHIVGDVAYMDTPGLADPTIMAQAAKAINTALKQGGTYKLFFMVRLQAGRVVSDDLVTIERVLDAITLPNIPFLVLVNNLGARQYEAMTRFGPEYDKVAALINKGKHQTPYIFFIPKFPQLDEVDNAIMKLPDPVHEFLDTRAPSVTIPLASVKQVNVEDFDKHAKELKAELEKLHRFRQDMEREREYHRRNVEYHRKFYDQSAPRQSMGDHPQSAYRVLVAPPPAVYERQSFDYAQHHDNADRSCPCSCVVM